MTATRLEKLKAINEGWKALAEGFDNVMAIMESLGDDYNIQEIKRAGGCAGILRFRSQLRNYADDYGIKYLRALERELEK